METRRGRRIRDCGQMPDIGNSLMSMSGKPEDWIFGIVDRQTADAAAVSQKVRKLSEKRHDGGRLKNNCSKHNFVRCPEKQVADHEVELRNVNVRR